jgi:hypothetical protein
LLLSVAVVTVAVVISTSFFSLAFSLSNSAILAVSDASSDVQAVNNASTQLETAYVQLDLVKMLNGCDINRRCKMANINDTQCSDQILQNQGGQLPWCTHSTICERARQGVIHYFRAYVDKLEV